MCIHIFFNSDADDYGDVVKRAIKKDYYIIVYTVDYI